MRRYAMSSAKIISRTCCRSILENAHNPNKLLGNTHLTYLHGARLVRVTVGGERGEG